MLHDKPISDTNTTDIDDLYRKQQTPSSLELRDNERNILAMNNDMKSLKETVANLKAEMLTMKRTNEERKTVFESKCTVLHSDVSELKTELTKCADVIRHHVSNATENGRSTLSEGLNAISRKIRKLESPRNNITSNIANVERSVQDNTVNITDILDSGTANKTNYKQHMRDRKDSVDSGISKVSDVSVLKTDYNAAMKSMG